MTEQLILDFYLHWIFVNLNFRYLPFHVAVFVIEILFFIDLQLFKEQLPLLTILAHFYPVTGQFCKFPVSPATL